VTIAFVQQVAPTVVGGASSGYLNGVDPNTLTFGSSTTNGNFIVVVVTAWASSWASLSVTDNKGNSYGSYVVHSQASGGNHSCFIFACPNIAGGSSHQVTVSNGGNVIYGAMWIAEFSGLATSSATDQTATTNASISSGATSYSVSTAALSQADELAIAAIYCSDTLDNAPIKTGSWNYGFDIGSSSTGVFNGGGIYEVLASTSAVTATWNFSNGTSSGSTSANAAIATFKAAGGGAETITLDKWWMPDVYRRPRVEMVGY
jgi:hypothetical protein